MQRTLARHEKYKIKQATGIQEVFKLEIEITKERFSNLFLNAVFDYAKVIHILEKARRTTATSHQSTNLGTLRRRPCIELNSQGGHDNPLNILMNSVCRLRQIT